MDNLKPLIRVIDDDDAMRRSWAFLIEGEGWEVVTYSNALAFLAANDFSRPGCLLLDVRMPRMSGLELQDALKDKGVDFPIIFISGHGDIDMAVRGLKQARSGRRPNSLSGVSGGRFGSAAARCRLKRLRISFRGGPRFSQARRSADKKTAPGGVSPGCHFFLRS